jgi:AcrR family transcriptional regulator
VSATQTTKRLPRAIREQQMLDAAIHVFSRRGFHAASMDDIAEAAGISKPMLYAYLGSKEALFIACLHREGTRMAEAIVAVVEPGLPPDEQLRRGLRAFFRFVGAHRDGWSMLYRQPRGEQRFAGEIAIMRARMLEMVAGMLRRAVPEQGRDVPHRELDIVAYALVGATESLADWLADHPDEDPDRTAIRMMNIAWLGAGHLLRGEEWRPSLPDRAGIS